MVALMIWRGVETFEWPGDGRGWEVLAGSWSFPSEHPASQSIRCQILVPNRHRLLVGANQA